MKSRGREIAAAATHVHDRDLRGGAGRSCPGLRARARPSRRRRARAHRRRPADRRHRRRGERRGGVALAAPWRHDDGTGRRRRKGMEDGRGQLFAWPSCARPRHARPCPPGAAHGFAGLAELSAAPTRPRGAGSAISLQLPPRRLSTPIDWSMAAMVQVGAHRPRWRLAADGQRLRQGRRRPEESIGTVLASPWRPGCWPEGPGPQQRGGHPPRQRHQQRLGDPRPARRAEGGSSGMDRVDQLDTLPGVGPVTAQKIVDWRTAHGPFRTVDDLDASPASGPRSTVEPLRDDSSSRSPAERHGAAVVADASGGVACAGLAASNWFHAPGGVARLVDRGVVVWVTGRTELTAEGPRRGTRTLAGLWCGRPRGSRPSYEASRGEAHGDTGGGIRDRDRAASSESVRGHATAEVRRFAGVDLRERVLLVLPAGRAPPLGAVFELRARPLPPRGPRPASTSAAGWPAEASTSSSRASAGASSAGGAGSEASRIGCARTSPAPWRWERAASGVRSSAASRSRRRSPHAAAATRSAHRGYTT